MFQKIVNKSKCFHKHGKHKGNILVALERNKGIKVRAKKLEENRLKGMSENVFDVFKKK